MKKIPKIGLRNIKTAVAVMLCFIIYIIISAIDQEFAFKWYTPFFAGIAACYGMQQSTSASIKNAKIRGYGSIIGGIFGMLIVLLYEAIFKATIYDMTSLQKMGAYFIVSLGIIVLIQLTILFKYTPATFIACLTYLSVTVSLRNNEMDAVSFAFNRILSTLIGLVIALGINLIKIPRHKNKEILFITGLDGDLLNKNEELSGFIKYKLNYLISRGANIAVATTRTPASISKIFNDVEMKLPFIIMCGSATYDINLNSFSNVINIKKEFKDAFEIYLKTNKYNAFRYIIFDDTLNIYYNELSNDGEKKYYFSHKNEYFQNYIKGEIPIEFDPCFYVIINTYDIVLKINDYVLCNYKEYVKTEIYPFSTDSSFYYLKIHSSLASKPLAVKNIVNNCEYIISFGSQSFDVSMMNESDYSFSLQTADENAKQAADKILTSSDPDYIIKTIERIYFSKSIYKKMKRKDK